jgi:tRNA(Ile)-lysidine synthase
MSERLLSVLRDECGLVPDRPVVAGVSGGPDSLCLLDVLGRAGYPVVVAHFNHRLRLEADREAEAVSGLARRLGLPFEIDSADVRLCAEADGLSIEEAARTLRYRFLFSTARKHAAQAVAVGHTADDQVETVLMHFLRGAGLAGLKGMPARTFLPVFDPGIPLVRPLLGLWRSDTEAYCREHDLQPHYDLSNTDQAYFRNRLRHSLIPELEKYAPRFKESLLRTAQALQGDFALLEEVLDQAWSEAVSGSGPGWVAFDASRLAQLSNGLCRNLIRRAAESLRPGNRYFGFDALERGAAFAGSPAGGPVDLVNGLYLFREGDRLYLAAYEADLPSAGWPQVVEELPLIIPGGLELEGGWLLSVEEVEAAQALERAHANSDAFQAWMDADLTGSRLTVRNAPPGTRFQPLGMNGQSLKLSDLFVNVKLPRRARRHWPVVYAGDIPLWVPGYRIADPFKVSEQTRKVIRLHLEKK